MLLIIWSLILTISIKIIYKEPLKISEVLKNVFVTDITNKYTGVLWFLQNLIMLYLIYPILKTVHDNDKKIYNYLFILLLISTSFINILDLISQLINAKYKFEPIRLIMSYISKFQVLYNRNFLVFFIVNCETKISKNNQHKSKNQTEKSKNYHKKYNRNRNF